MARNNRQHKKLSKQAMELLISRYKLERDNFSLECELGVGKYRQEWHWWSAPCYWYGESDQYSATSLLMQIFIDNGTDWSVSPPVYVGGKLPRGKVALIRLLKSNPVEN